uniref:Mothers against decapentaplegic homolog n=1 Tax=Panagrellus redivivus TaxID=6233 RepID=A0A7E5A136_PANRE
MTGHASTAVPTCQYPGPGNNFGVPDFCNSSNGTSQYYSNPNRDASLIQNNQNDYVFPTNSNPISSEHLQQAYYNNYISVNNSFYPMPVLDNGVPFYDTSTSFDIDSFNQQQQPFASFQPSINFNLIPKTEVQDDLWNSTDPNQASSSQMQSSDPCVQVVQVLSCYHQGGEDPDFVRKAIESLVKKLKDKRTELDALISAVTSGGKEQTSCVTIHRSLDGRLQVAGKKGVPHVVYARIWRWPNVSKNELQKMDCCRIAPEDPDLICVNPFHYERVVSSEYRNLDMSTLNNTQMPVDFSNILSMQSTTSACPMESLPVPLQHNMNTMGVQQNAPQFPSNIGTAATEHMISPRMHPIQHPHIQHSFSGEDPSFGLSQPQVMSTSPAASPMLTGAVLMYGASQQPNYVIQHNAREPPKLINNALPSFAHEEFNNVDEWNQSNPFHVNDDTPILYRYNKLRAMIAHAQQPMSESSLDLPDWCSITYYELDTQIGETFNVPAHQEEITIDGGMDPGGARLGRFCLGALSNVHRTEASERVRIGIGKGVKLRYHRDGSVFLECLSDTSVFVRSNYMDFENNMIYGSTVHKFSTGAVRKVFDLSWAHAEMLEQQSQQQAARHAYEQRAHAGGRSQPTVGALENSVIGVDDLRRVCCTIAISFVKGWGAGYNRKELKETPCWIEVQLHKSLQLLNNFLQP